MKKNQLLPIVIVLGIVAVCVLSFVGFLFWSEGSKELIKEKREIVSKAESEKEAEKEIKNIVVTLEESKFSVKANGQDSQRGETKEVTQGGSSSVLSENNGEYLLIDSDIRSLSESDLIGLSARELTLARNEIYARYGRVFKSQELSDYFMGKSWYVPDSSFDDESISELEKRNAKLIDDYQKKHNMEYKAN